MQTKAKVNSPNHFEHSDVIRIIGHSHSSFEDAVSTAIQQLANPAPGHDHHKHLTFVAFKVVEMRGVIEHNKSRYDVLHYSVTLDVEAHHGHPE